MNTLVIDNGAYTIKAGFARRAFTDHDCVTVPNCIARTRDKRTLIGKQLNSCKDFGSISFRQPVEKVAIPLDRILAFDVLFADAVSGSSCELGSTERNLG